MFFSRLPGATARLAAYCNPQGGKIPNAKHQRRDGRHWQTANSKKGPVLPPGLLFHRTAMS
jgi:hypothetical protein